MIEKIRNNIVGYIDVDCVFKINGSRNQMEVFKGKIINVYPFIFIVKTIEEGIIKSFSYVDILIGTLEISKFTL